MTTQRTASNFDRAKFLEALDLMYLSGIDLAYIILTESNFQKLAAHLRYSMPGYSASLKPDTEIIYKTKIEVLTHNEYLGRVGGGKTKPTDIKEEIVMEVLEGQIHAQLLEIQESIRAQMQMQRRLNDLDDMKKGLLTKNIKGNN